VELEYDELEAIRFVEQVAAGELTFEDVAAWIGTRVDTPHKFFTKRSQSGGRKDLSLPLSHLTRLSISAVMKNNVVLVKNLMDRAEHL